MSGDDLAEVEEANSRFYRAFETLDLAEMDAVWAHTGRVQCVHPGWPLIAGWAAVRESWETIFVNTTEMRFTISDVRVAGGPDVAWVTCTENILADVQGPLASRRKTVRPVKPKALAKKKPTKKKSRR